VRALKDRWELLKVGEVQRDEVRRLSSGAEAVARVTLITFVLWRRQRP